MGTAGTPESCQLELNHTLPKDSSGFANRRWSSVRRPSSQLHDRMVVAIGAVALCSYPRVGIAFLRAITGVFTCLSRSYCAEFYPILRISGNLLRVGD